MIPTGSLAAAVAALAIAAGTTPPAAATGMKRLLPPTSKCEGPRPASDRERAVRCMINYARRQSGLPRLEQARALKRSSKGKSGDIARCQDFSHTACGRAPLYWFKKVGYARNCWGAGENLAWGTGRFASPRSTVTRWLKSPPHRRVIMTRRYRRIGLHVRESSLRGHSQAEVWVGHFGYRC
jgi:uncharacterized protein YkwD